jgi:multidrug efflux system membrane fusion protein
VTEDDAPDSLARPSRKPARRRMLGLLVVLAGLAGLAAWWALKPGAERPSRRPADASVTVRVDTVTRGDMPEILDGLGTVTALSTVTVKTQINGNLTEVAFHEGQAVKKGDFLAQIDPRPYQAALDQAEGQLARDEALLAQARIDLARFEKLMTQDSIARQQVDTQGALVKQDEAIVRSDKAAVDTATINLNYCHIVSPTDGRVGLRLVDPGNYVQTSDAGGIVVITQMQPMSVIFPLPQDTIPQFIPKLRAGTPMTVLAYDRNATKLLATGTLTTVDNQIDTTTGTVKLRATFPNEDELLFPNQFVNIKLVTDTLHDATLMSSAGVQMGVPGTYTYVANADGTVSVRPVKLGPADAQRVVVREGLAPGDKVVVDGADRLRDGAKITIANTDAPSEPKAPENRKHGGSPGGDHRDGK